MSHVTRRAFDAANREREKLLHQRHLLGLWPFEAKRLACLTALCDQYIAENHAAEFARLDRLIAEAKARPNPFLGKGQHRTY